MAFNYNFNSHFLESPGYITCDVADCVKDELKKSILEIEQNKNSRIDYRSKLAGHLEKEYELPITPNIKYLVESLSYEYDKLFFEGKSYFSRFHVPNDDGSVNYNYKLETLWINYSKKYDFNPIHTHSGAFSFVIWVSIPYDLDAELSCYSPNKTEVSLFSFSYTNTLGQIVRKMLYIDKNWEWKMAFFPATLSHSVNPFYTSDEYRISISGNIYYYSN